jgi:hypothetical protein
MKTHHCALAWKHMRFVGWAALIFAFAGCGSNSGTNDNSFYPSDASSPHDLQITSLEFVESEGTSSEEKYTLESATSSQALSGHEVHIDYTVSSSTAEPGETTIYFYAGLAEYDGDLEDNETIVETNDDILLGTAVLSSIPQGFSNYSTMLRIPYSLSGGEYRIYGFIDPMNLIKENNESNNYPPSDPEADHLYLDLNVTESNATDIRLEQFELVQSTILLEDENNSEHNFSNHEFEANINILHFSPSKETNLTIVCQIKIGDIWHNLDLWDNAQQNYVKDLNVTVANDTDAYHAHLHISIPDDVWQDINLTKTNYYFMRVAIESDAEKGQFTLNNTSTQAITILKDKGQTPQKLSTNAISIASTSSTIDQGLSNSFTKGVGDKDYFYGDLSLDAEAGGDTANNRMVVQAGSDITLYVFGGALTLFYSNAEMYCAESTVGRSATVEFIGQTLYDESQEVNTHLNKEFSKEQLLAKATFTVGPVPVSVEASATGTLGIDLTLTCSNESFVADGKPYANFTAIGTGGVDAGVASAGVDVELTLIDDEFHAIPSITPTYSSNKLTKVTGEFKVTNDVTLVDGSAGLYAIVADGIDTCKSCKKFFGKKICVSYPCGLSYKEYETTLFDITGFSQSQTLYDKTMNFTF